MTCECDGTEEPMSVEEFERTHAPLVGAIENAVRRVLATTHADGYGSRNVQSPFDLYQVSPDLPLVQGDSLNCVGQGNDGVVDVPSGRVCLRVLRGIDGFAFHAITSFLMVGTVIVACGVALGKASARP